VKKVTKIDFKKMVLAGIAGGAVLSGQLSANQDDSSSNLSSLLAHNCGGKHGCGHNGEKDDNNAGGGAQSGQPDHADQPAHVDQPAQPSKPKPAEEPTK